MCGARAPSHSANACHLIADELAGMYYGARHPMKPQRITMTHHLVLGYRLHEHMDVYVRPHIQFTDCDFCDPMWHCCSCGCPPHRGSACTNDGLTVCHPHERGVPHPSVSQCCAFVTACLRLLVCHVVARLCRCHVSWSRRVCKRSTPQCASPWAAAVFAGLCADSVALRFRCHVC